MQSNTYTIAFDCDGTILNTNGVPRPEIVAMVKAFAQSPEWIVVVWSGGGAWYAEKIARQIGLDELVTTMAKTNDLKPDVAVDDQYVELGKINIRV